MCGGGDAVASAREADRHPVDDGAHPIEHYVLTICERIVGRRAPREYHFGWVRADPDARGARRRLPVDAYWPEHSAAAQYYPGPIIPHLATVSARTVQRLPYDQRRRDQLARYRMHLVEISSEQLAHRGTKLLRDVDHEMAVPRPLVQAALP